MSAETGQTGWPQWSRVDDRGLARFVTPEAQRWVPLEINRLDAASSPDHYRIIAGAIYEALLKREIRYALERYHPSEALQAIRTPEEIVEAPREGTCLDLAVLFCGLCEAYELLPLLIVINGHALAAVSLTHGVREWNSLRLGSELFATDPLTDGARLRQLIDDEEFLAVECTGFAQSTALTSAGVFPEAGPRTNGVMTFTQATEAGRAQLDQPLRPFQFALDIAVAHFGWRIEPHPVVRMPGGWNTSIFRLLTSTPAPLATHLKVLDFERIVEERTRRFVGREFVFQAVDALLNDPATFPSGYILIRGEPGIGKTALLSQLVKTRGYIHHFNVAPQNIRSTQTFLENVCVQLIVRYQLDHVTLPPEASQDSAFLGQLLNEARAKQPDRPVVILIDALDEAENVGLPTGANRLFLPRVLPDGVFFVMTSREQMDYRLDVDRRKDLHVRDDDPANLDDIRAYVQNFIGTHRTMTAAIAGWKVTEDAFIELMTSRSEGNFMYLVHVLEDILGGTLSPGTLDRIEDLPVGLRQYYERHWRTMQAQDPARFESIYEPVLRLLATVREPVSLAALEEWTKLDPARIRTVIREWRGFLNELASPDGGKLYRVYHTSFQDFLAEEGMGLKPFHQRIAEAALRKIPGFLGT